MADQSVPAKKLKIESTEDDAIACSICRKEFASAIALQNHARMEHFGAYTTGEPSNWTLQKVKEEVSEDEIQQNTEVLLSSMGPGSLMNLVSEDVSYIIIKSEEPFVGKKRLKRDDRQGSEEGGKMSPKKPKIVKAITGPFECLQPSTLVAEGTCHQIFFSCCEYSLHFRDEHTRKRKAIQCQVCEKPLGEGLGLNDPNPFACDVCDITYQTKKELKDHINKVHIVLKPFQCSTCQKRFTQQGGLQQHMRMHAGIRPFPCTICPKAFTQKSGLDQHLRIHTKVKPYHCVVCQKSFIQSIHLTQHMRTHTNVSPFECEKCKKKFKQKSHLDYHLRSNHGIVDPNKINRKYMCTLANPTDVTEVIEIDIDQSEAALIEQVEAEKSIIPNNENRLEEAIEVMFESAETVQIEQVNDESYIIDDDEPGVWNVELVDS